MNKGRLLELLKLKLGISTILRDKPLEKIIDAVISELGENLGVVLDPERADHEMFVVDFAAYRCVSGVEMPRYLQLRLHNLQVSSKGKVSDVEQ